MPCFERVRPFECIGVQVFGSLTCFLEGSRLARGSRAKTFADSFHGINLPVCFL